MHDTTRDPVCGMNVSYENAIARSDYDGQTYYFCSLNCKEDFDREPERYVTHQQSTHNQ